MWTVECGANNPIMIGLVEALSSFSVPRERVRVLSLGCGTEPFRVGKLKRVLGGKLMWYDIFFAAMRLQSLNALGQAGLLTGADRIARIDVPSDVKPIDLDDWAAAMSRLPSAAEEALDQHGDAVASMFLQEPVLDYEPFEF